jgi:hypothetical protein
MQDGLIPKLVISGGGKVTVTVLSPETATHPPEPVASARYVVVAVGETVKVIVCGAAVSLRPDRVSIVFPLESFKTTVFAH